MKCEFSHSWKPSCFAAKGEVPWLEAWVFTQSIACSLQPLDQSPRQEKFHLRIEIQLGEIQNDSLDVVLQVKQQQGCHSATPSVEHLSSCGIMLGSVAQRGSGAHSRIVNLSPPSVYVRWIVDLSWDYRDIREFSKEAEEDLSAACGKVVWSGPVAQLGLWPHTGR